ncbi:QacE [Shewanella morhuae]|uniref:QacE n=2 Tax=Shewanella morhuae TaxID=365591 RepID=A0ABX5HNU1_9GAMM|nr:DUF6232 family protein [Shewanella morhuae]PTA48375.1 QacE [Shewanella morhuae]
MEEKVFFNQGNVSVSNSRFIVSGQTYAISNVTSVKSGIISASKGAAVFLIFIGLCCFLGGFIVKIIGVIFLALGVFSWKGAKDKYTVILNTSAGENKALMSEDKSYIESVITALNNAIISRG